MNKKFVLISMVAIIMILAVGFFLIFQESTLQKDESGKLHAKTSSTTISSLVLDLPEGYALQDKAPRVKSELSENSLKLGWIEGYKISFSKSEDTIFSITRIDQLISKYSLENITKLIIIPEETEGVTVDEIPIEKIGDESKAFKIIDENDFAGSGGYYQIQFRKMDILETLTISGTSQNFELLKELARKAENKIK